MNAKIGRYGCYAAEKFIKSQKSREIIWRTSRIHEEQSFVGALQLLSDKSVILLEANGMDFYPLHITVLSYTEERRRYQVQHGNTITAYLPVHDQTTDADCHNGHCYETSRECEKLSRPMILQLLHILMDRVIQPLAFNALQGLRIVTADNMLLRRHLVLG